MVDCTYMFCICVRCSRKGARLIRIKGARCPIIESCRVGVGFGEMAMCRLSRLGRLRMMSMRDVVGNGQLRE